MIRGAILDVDGVLLDSMEIWVKDGDRFLKNRGIEPKEDLGEAMWAMTFSEGARYLKEQYDLPMTVQEVMDGILQEIRDFYFFEAPLKEGAREFLEEMRKHKIPMVIASAGEKCYVKKAFERLGIDSFFKGIVTAADAGAGKRDPMIYRMAAECLGTDPGETFVFEDVIHAIRTAKAAGFQTAGVYDRFSDKDRKEIMATADVYLESLPDFFVHRDAGYLTPRTPDAL